LKVGAVAAAIAIVAGARVRRDHPFARLGPANQVTALRALLVAATAGLIGEPPHAGMAWTAIGLALAATVLDGVDGQLARRTQMSSAFGARFDMEVDALLILVLAILAWRHGKAGPWVLLAGLWRYLFVAAGWVLPWMRAPLTPTRRAKITCVIQIGGLLVALAPLVHPPASAEVAAASLTLLSASFVADIARLWRMRV
jgi:phosphatidylglycerophosphate synthase